jgi:hypothetical protein
MTTMTGEELLTIYRGLEAPPESGSLSFATEPLPERPKIRLGRNAASVALLFASGEQTPRVPISLRHLSVLFNTQCVIHDQEGKREGSFTVVTCDTSDDHLVEYFLHAFSALLGTLSEQLHPTEIAATVQALVELFRVMQEPPRATSQGLWGELLLIAEAADPQQMLRSWHALPNDRYDFALGDERIEAKVALRSRKHRFSLEQLEPGPLTVFVASLVTESTSTGSTVAELVKEIADKCSEADLVRALVTKVAGTLGSDWQSWSTYRFDRTLTLDSLRYFAVGSIPRVGEVPAEVSEVRFAVDLAKIEESHEKPALGTLLAAAPSPPDTTGS